MNGETATADGGESELTPPDEWPAWEVGVHAHGDDRDDDEWEIYEVRAPSEDDAEERGVEEAKDGLNAIVGPRDGYAVYMISGPYSPDDAATDGPELSQEEEVAIEVNRTRGLEPGLSIGNTILAWIDPKTHAEQHTLASYNGWSFAW